MTPVIQVLSDKVLVYVNAPQASSDKSFLLGWDEKAPALPRANIGQSGG